MAYWTTSSFVPYDATHQRRFKLPTTASQGTGQSGYSLSITNQYRQGGELRLPNHILSSDQPKFWGGRIERDGIISHEINPIPYGQTTESTQFFGYHYFDAQLTNFDPVAFIELGSDYPYPIIYNDGPQAQQESIMEPLTIPMRLPTNEGRYNIHAIHGYFESGNALDGLGNGNSVITQYTPFSSSATRPYLAEGAVLLGETLSGSVRIEGYLSKVQRKVAPYNALSKNFVLNRITSFTSSNESSEMKNALRVLKFDTNNEEEKQYGTRGSPAGYTVYGPGQALYGRDSIAFIGYLKGS